MGLIVLNDGGQLVLNQGGQLIMREGSAIAQVVGDGVWLTLFFIGLLLLTKLIVGNKEND